MSANNNGSCNDPDNEEVEELERELRNNIGRVVTVFTQSGGCTGRGFTGLLVRVEDDVIRLITSLPSAPPHPFCLNEFSESFNRSERGRCRCSRFGTAIVIPINKIVSFAFNDR